MEEDNTQSGVIVIHTIDYQYVMFSGKNVFHGFLL